MGKIVARICAAALLLVSCGRPQVEAPAPLIHATYSVYSRLSIIISRPCPPGSLKNSLAAGETVHMRSVNGMAPDDPARTCPALDLGPYRLVDETGRITRYRVEDRSSGRSFDE